MIGALAWGLVALGAIGLEVVALVRGRVGRFSLLVARARSSWGGRLGLWLIWAFVGWHVFARYTIHGL